MIATGSLLALVIYQGKTYSISQCNNVYVFPGLGLGLILSQATKEVMRLGLTSMSASVEFEERLKRIVWEPAYPEIRKTGIFRRLLSAVFRR